jgi:AraC-like DNA-binding protein
MPRRRSPNPAPGPRSGGRRARSTVRARARPLQSTARCGIVIAMRSTGSVSSPVIQRILAMATSMGVPANELVASTGISAEALADRDARLPIDVLFLVFDEIERRIGDLAFGLHAAEASRRAPDHVLALAVQSSPTLGDAFRRAARYTRIINDAAEVEIAGAGELVHLRYRIDHPRGTHRLGAQAAIALLCLLARQTVGARFRAVRAGFCHAAPDAATQAEYARVFEAPVTFAGPVNELVVPREVLAEPLIKADPALCAHLDRHLDVLLERTGPADLRARVCRLLGQDLSAGPPDVEWLAERMHMSSRSLQRRLRDAGTSFQELRDTLRRDLALRYLEEGLALAEVAFLIGFTEASNFHRAFKRWTGMTPAEARGRSPDRVDARPGAGHQPGERETTVP